ncbi:undecaprenyl-phosphate glucose phosphotransferase [Vibrio furnissii]|uniref:undecaprenyl-phosphate glucose phosphotransferase n=1 Tax=Vibrio furnissii TaxID=29494 RepID=UPI0001B93564|nr:undecaprenyl-phosphate glucose phosphotransferase [Vibrio furnissii]EEX39739.1 Capsular polysaccharide synthesis enzyme CpsA sugar transferase [Vibrio furnissii CIP 102972]QDC94488.1 undecaprenyl-phosphate glucose phosphotransferase [Vibrio furnissii]UON49930.1 undecaprenyl-phosphate glucose phosphotransferase [Vibrio furnissii]SUQ33644.1 undecaprenyl-phosphate glucose phosphotransferase [Vibrio furnissii]
MKSRKALQLAGDGYATLLKIVDFLIINISLTFIIRLIGAKETAIDATAAFLFSVIFLLAGEYINLYAHSVLSRVRRSFVRLVCTLIVAALAMQVVKYTFRNLDGYTITNLNNTIFYQWYVLLLVCLAAVRMVTISIVRLVRKSMNKKRRVAVIGLTPGGLTIERALMRAHRPQDLEITFYDDRNENRFAYPIRSPMKGKVAPLIELAKEGGIDEVFIALPMVARDRIRHYLDELSDSTVDTYLVPDLYTYNLNVSQLKRIGGVQTFSIFSSPFDGMGKVIKRIEDIVIGSMIALLISPVLIAVAVGVKLSSPGPVLFKQDRYGLGGKKIKVWKFRSMKVMENDAVVTQATKNDPRVTKFGAFIRRTSLDELPQFLNVLQGSMSIVGPRPHAVAHNEQYRKIVDNYMIRHKIKPGITGWAQINGYRGETETVDKMEKRVRYDIQYMQNWSLWLDIKIIFLTVFKGFVSETAY